MMESAAPKEASVEEVCVKSEPSLEDVGIKSESESSWDHLCKTDELCENVYVKTESSFSEVCVKDEPPYTAAADVRGVSAAARLYADHVVKDELVLGPELVQPRRALGAAPGQIQQKEQIESSKSDEWRCGHCTYTVSDKAMLLNHLTIHGPIRFYKCGQCNHISNGIANLLVHEKKHAAKKPCKFGQDSDAGDKRSYTQNNKCIYTSEDTITVHQCKLCSFATSQESNLKVHERIHTDEKLYKCGQCSFATFQRSKLKTHERLHTGEDLYRCDQCSFSSAYRHNLKAHERVHTGEKPYKCGKCSFASARKYDLKVHDKKHTRERL